MYTHVHSVVGVAIVGSTYAITKDIGLTIGIGGLLSIISHHYVDKLGEDRLPKSVQYATEIAVHLNLLLLPLGELYWLPILGILSANFMDIVDKKFGLVFYKDDIEKFCLEKGWTRVYMWTKDNLGVGRFFK